MTEHHFGGPWTDLKLDAVEDYLNFYTSALKNKGFHLWYIDAFAGTGERHYEIDVGGLHEGMPVERALAVKAGSARRAMAVDPPFRHIIMIEKDRRRRQTLQSFVDGADHPDARVLDGDANDILRRTFLSEPWYSSVASKGPERGVVFLDPYGMGVDWSTLELIARTQSVDLWYLFPIGAVLRQMPRDLSKIDQSKIDALTRMLGTDQWRDVHYEEAELDMFGHSRGTFRVAGGPEIEKWFQDRLTDNFSYVSDPLRLFQTKGAQLFSLFFCMSNPRPAAINLARKCIKSIERKFGAPAIRRRSGR